MAPSSAGSRKRSRSRSGSASAIVADCASGYHDLKIDGYSRTKSLANGEALKSCPFTAGGYSWRIFYYPGGQTPGCADYVSLLLRLDEDVPAAVMAEYQFRFLGDVGEQGPPLTLTRNKFTSWKGWGLCKFITREELERSVHLKDDTFTVRCDIVVTKEFRSEETTTTPSEESCFVAVPPPDLQRHLGDLLHSEKGADVVFEAGGETFAAHWCVLAARSPVFGAELFGSMKESDATAGVVRIDDMEAQVFKALLRFAYTDSLPEMEKKDEGAMCQHPLVAADRYAMERLKLVCEEKLCEHIDVSSVATILALAEQHHCDGLRNACFDFLSSPENLKAAMAGDGFENLSKSCPSLLKELIAMLGNFVP